MDSYNESAMDSGVPALDTSEALADATSLDRHDLPSIGERWPHYRENSLLEGAAITASDHVQVAYDMAVSSALGVMSAACQGLVDVTYPNNHVVPTSLMMLTIAESGDRKTAVDNVFCEPLKAFEKLKEIENRQARAHYQRELNNWKLKEKALNKALSKRFQAGDETESIEAALHELDAQRPQPPTNYKLIYNNTTPSALAFGMHENMPLAFLLSDEAGSLLQGQALRDLYLFNSLWSGSDITVDRRTSESFILSDSRLSASLMVQPAILKRFMDKRGDEAHDSGFFARFLVSYPEPQLESQENLSSPITGDDIDRFQARVHERLEMSIRAIEEGRPKTKLEFTAAATSLWKKLYTHIHRERRQDRLYAHARSHAGKLMDNISRVAAIVHTFENENYESKISSEDLLYAYSLCRHYSRNYLTYIAGDPKVVRLANMLVRAIRKYGFRNANIAPGIYTFSRSDITKNANQDLRKHENIEDALKLLTRLGHIRAYSDRGGQNYELREVITLKGGQEPEIKNGEEYYVEELPRFSEQETYHVRWGSGYRLPPAPSQGNQGI